MSIALAVCTALSIAGELLTCFAGRSTMFKTIFEFGNRPRSMRSRPSVHSCTVALILVK